MCGGGGGLVSPAKIVFKHFFICFDSMPLTVFLFFYNNKLAFSPSKTKKKKQC